MDFAAIRAKAQALADDFKNGLDALEKNFSAAGDVLMPKADPVPVHPEVHERLNALESAVADIAVAAAPGTDIVSRITAVEDLLKKRGWLQ
jgi:hypothetical protein